MAYKIGARIAIEGEKEFRQQIANINGEYKTLQAQTKALSAEYDTNGDKQGKLRMKTEQLSREIANRRAAQTALEGMVAKAKQTDALYEQELEKLRAKLADAKKAAAEMKEALGDAAQEDEGYRKQAEEAEKLERQLTATTRAQEQNTKAMDAWQRQAYRAQEAAANLEGELRDVGEAQEDAGKKTGTFADVLKANLTGDAIKSALKELSRLVKQIGTEAVEAAAEIRAETAMFSQTFGEMESAATEALERLERNTGISATRVRGSFATIYAFAKTMGADTAASLEIAERAMVAAADSAAYYDRTMEETLESVKSYLKGNYQNDAALGIASTEATRNAKAMQLYGKSFTDLTEDLKVDVLLAMVEAGNEASGAMGQAARESGEWLNVTAELDDAWEQLMAALGDPVIETLTPLVQNITQALREMSEQTAGQALADGLADIASAAAAAEAEFLSTQRTTVATATVAGQYLDRLAALEEQGIETAEAQKAYNELVQMLGYLMPELNLTIDDETGLLQQNILTLREQVDAWKDAAIAKAAYTKMQTQLEAYGEASLTLATAKVSRSELVSERDRLLAELADQLGVKSVAQVEMTYVGGAAGNKIFDIYDESGKKIESVGASLIGKLLGTNNALAETAWKISEVDEQLVELGREMTDAETIVADYEAQIAELVKQLEGYTDTEDQEAAEKTRQEAISATQEALEELKESYATAKSAARQSLDSSVGLWSEMAEKSEWSAKKVLENWRGQIKAFSDYKENLQKAKQIGLADGIVEALSDGSEQSMQILDAMVNQSQYSVGEINAAFTDLDLAKDDAAEAIVALDDSLQEGYAQLEQTAKDAGVQIVDGIAQAIRDNAYKVGDALADATAGATVQAEAEDVLGALTHAVPSAAGHAEAHGMTTTQITGDIYITQQPGEDAEAFAERVIGIMTDRTTRKGAGLRG